MATGEVKVNIERGEVLTVMWAMTDVRAVDPVLVIKRKDTP